MKKTLLFSLLALGILTPATFAQEPVQDTSSEKEAPKEESAETTSEEKKEEGTPIDENSIVGRMATAVRNYYSAKSPKDRLAFVINPERIEPLMRDFYFREAYIPGAVVQMTTPESFSNKGVAFWRTQVALADGRRAFVAMQMIDGTPKVDWESEVRYSTANWKEWLAGKEGDVAEFRVYAVADTYYPKAYGNREKYFCLKVTTSDSPESVFAYLDLADLDQREFAQLLAQGGTSECVLSLKKVKNEGDIPMAIVEKVVSPSWVIPQSSLEKKAQ